MTQGYPHPDQVQQELERQGDFQDPELEELYSIVERHFEEYKRILDSSQSPLDKQGNALRELEMAYKFLERAAIHEERIDKGYGEENIVPEA